MCHRQHPCLTVERVQQVAASTFGGRCHTSLPSYLAFGAWDILPSRVVESRQGRPAQTADPSLEVGSESLVVSAEGMAASAPCPAEIQKPKVVEAESLGSVEAVAELEHLGPPVGTETHPEWSVAVFEVEMREAAASLPPTANPAWGSTTGGVGVEHPCPKETIGVGTGVGHPSQTADFGETGVEHLIPNVVGCSCPWRVCRRATRQSRIVSSKKLKLIT